MEKTEKSKKASWNAAKDTFLLDELVAAKRMGHKTELGFKKFVWNDACARLNDRFMTNLDKGQLKCRFQVLRKQYNTFVSLKNDERFNWDEERQAIIASDADWDRYLEANPIAKPFRTTPFKHLAAFDDIYVNSFVPGSHSSTSTDPQQGISPAQAAQIVDADPDQLIDEDMPISPLSSKRHHADIEYGDHGEDVYDCDHPEYGQPVAGPSRTARRQSSFASTSAGKAPMLNQPPTQSKRARLSIGHAGMSEATSPLNSPIQRFSPPMTHVERALRLLRPLREEQKWPPPRALAASMIFQENEQKAAFFCALDPDLRLAWIEKQLTP